MQPQMLLQVLPSARAGAAAGEVGVAVAAVGRQLRRRSISWGAPGAAGLPEDVSRAGILRIPRVLAGQVPDRGVTSMSWA